MLFSKHFCRVCDCFQISWNLLAAVGLNEINYSTSFKGNLQSILQIMSSMESCNTTLN